MDKEQFAMIEEVADWPTSDESPGVHPDEELDGFISAARYLYARDLLKFEQAPQTGITTRIINFFDWVEDFFASVFSHRKGDRLL